MNKKLLSTAAMAGIALGGVTFASVASAQDAEMDYGTSEPAATVENEVDAPVADPAAAVEIQDTDDAPAESDAPADGDAPADDGDRREGCNGEGRRGGRGLGTAADVIGIESDALREALNDGQSIADVAAANGVDAEDVIDALVAEKTERIDGAVESGRLTQDEADERLAELEDRITEKVNQVRGDDDVDEA